MSETEQQDPETVAHHETRRFRVMGGPSVPWSFVAPYEAQAFANHDQSLERLHERGGLDPCELWAVVHGCRYRDAPDEATCRAWLDNEVAGMDALRAEVAELRVALGAACELLDGCPCGCRPADVCKDAFDAWRKLAAGAAERIS